MLAGEFTNVIEQSELLGQRSISQRGIREFLHQRRQHFAGFADEKAVGHLAEPAELDVWQHVVAHVFLVKNRIAAGDWPGQPSDHLFPVVLIAFDDFVGHGVG